MALLTAFEHRVSSHGFRRVSLGSAGGYVDEFYVGNGYSPDSVLVRLDANEEPPVATEYDIVDERNDGGMKKLYVEADEFDPEFVEDGREASEDPAASSIMTKELDAT